MSLLRETSFEEKNMGCVFRLCRVPSLSQEESLRLFPISDTNYSLSIFYREKERTELKNKIEELEEFKHKYEAEKQQKEVSKMWHDIRFWIPGTPCCEQGQVKRKIKCQLDLKLNGRSVLMKF